MTEQGNEKQKQVVAPFKVDPELKQKIDDMIEASGMRKNEWLAQAYEAMRGKGIKDTNEEYTKEIEEVEYHTRRLYELFNNIIVQSVHIKQSAVAALEKEIEQYKETLQETRDKLKKCTEGLSEAETTTENMKQEKELLESQYEEVKNSFNNTQDLIAELKDKIQKYETDISILQPMAQENIDLKSHLDDTLQTLNGLDSKMANLENETAKQKAEFEEREQLTKKNHVIEVNSIREQHEEEINKLNTYHEQQLKQHVEQERLDKEKELLQQEKLHQQEMKKVQEEMNLKIQSLYEKMDKKEEKHEKEIAKLQKRLELMQNIEEKKRDDKSQ
ncbi:hypothetical protein M3215_11860 [Bacillus cytotoxicus]|uniref:Uncharacterized protein n=1 Tax=Bacillus cytotoxicus TaxID=580165 RepID=A0ACC6A6X3_9BACI|nr:hypothetical protein [Bacillus cytotoxicus]